MKNLTNFFTFVKNRTLQNTDIYYKVNAFLGEIGEYSNILKKQHFRKVFDTYQVRVDKEVKEGNRVPERVQKVDELGDVFFYFIQILQQEGISLSEITEAQIKKIKLQDIRFKKKFLK